MDKYYLNDLWIYFYSSEISVYSSETPQVKSETSINLINSIIESVINMNTLFDNSDFVSNCWLK